MVNILKDLKINSFLSGDRAILALLALLKFLVHAFTNATGGYGYFRDELYYIACTTHPDIGYVDQPPLSIFILAVSRFLFGDSIFALRFLPSLAGAATVFLTGTMARELGGGRFAQVLAAVASLVSLIYLGMNTIFSMNSFDVLFWTVSAFLIIRLLKTENPRYWLLLGLVLGLGLLNKIGVLWLAFGLFAGLLLTPHRKWFTTQWPWLSGAIALIVFLPYIIWNITHDFAHLEFIRNATSDKYSSLSWVTFAAGQPLLQNPLTLPVWLTGLCLLFFSRQFKQFQLLGYIYVMAFLILALNQHSKSEYLASAYGMLFAAGSVGLEQWFSGRTWLKAAYLALLVLSGIVFAPAVLPVLPVETYVRYADILGIAPSTAENKQLGELPQFYADMFGWEEKADAIARVFHTLSDQDQQKCAIFADNYGRCGAIDFFGKKYGLPPSIGGHNNYWLWGPRNYTGEVVIILGGDLEDKQERFEHVEVADTVKSMYCMPYENNLRIYVCRNLSVPLEGLWPQLKSYN